MGHKVIHLKSRWEYPRTPPQSPGGASILKRRVYSSEFLKRTPKSYQDPVLQEWLEIFFTTKRYQFQNNTLSPVRSLSPVPVLLFLLNTLNGTTRAPVMAFFEADHPKRNQNRFFNPNRYDKHHRPISIGSPLRGELMSFALREFCNQNVWIGFRSANAM